VSTRCPVAYYAAFFAGACLRRIVAYVAVIYGFEVLGGGIWSGLFYLCLVSPYLLSVYAGSVIDAASKRLVLQVSSALPVLILGLLAGADHWHWLGSGAAHGWLMAALLGGYGIVSAFAYPAFLAVVPDIVDRAAMGRTTAMVNVLSMLCYVCGPLAAGLLRAWLSWSGLVAALAGCAVLAWLLLLFVPLPAHRPGAAPVESEWERQREMLAYCRQHAGLFALLVASGVFAGFVVGPLEVLGPLYAQDPLGYAPLRASLFMAAGGIGLLSGAIAALWLVGRGRLAAWLCGSGVGGGAFIVGLTLAPAWAAFPLFFAGGFLGGVFNSLSLAATQERTPDHLRGRVLGLLSLILGATPALSGLATGALISAVGTVVAMRLVFTGVIAAFVLLYFKQPALNAAPPTGGG
jgi:DHA3 family macrolide efflux protein-like MFS transporter